MFEYGDKVKTVIDGAEGTIIGFMRNKIDPVYDKFLVQFENGNPETWLRADSLEIMENDETGSN